MSLYKQLKNQGKKIQWDEVKRLLVVMFIVFLSIGATVNVIGGHYDRAAVFIGLIILNIFISLINIMSDMFTILEFLFEEKVHQIESMNKLRKVMTDDLKDMHIKSSRPEEIN